MPPRSPVSAVAVLATLLVFPTAGCGGEKAPAAPTAPASEEQQRPSGAMAMAAWPISPTVMVTFITRLESENPPQPPPSPPPSGPATLELMVLWRGEPGWFMKGGGQSSSGGGDANGQVYLRHEQAGVVLEVNFETQKGIAHIGRQEVVLAGANVILVDYVDVPGGRHVAGTRSVDPRTEALPDGVYTVLRNAPDLIPFLRCEARLPEPAGFMQQVLDASCSKMVVK